jgi:hypothetical protein
MDALDEDQIVAEVKGDVIDQYFYTLPASMGSRTGISYSGIKWICRKLAEQGEPISVEESYITESTDGRSYLARFKAVDLKTREVRWGYAEQPRYKSIKIITKEGADERLEPIPFAYVIAASKANRNALRQFVPEIVIQKAYEEWKTKQPASKGPG